MARKHKEYLGTSTRIVEELEFNGYVVKEADLQELDSQIRASTVFQGEATRESDPSYLAFLENGKTFRFTSVEDLCAHPNTEPEVIIGLEIVKKGHDNEKVSVLLERDGGVSLEITGPSDVVEGQLHSLRQHVRTLDQHYSWAAMKCVLDPHPSRIAASLAVLCSGLLLSLVVYYIYALFVGVDVDPDLLLQGMTYYEEVEQAIQSEDALQKLNVLLKGRYEGFVNVSDFLQTCKKLMSFLLVAALLTGAGAWVMKRLRRYYPTAFFALGRQNEQFTRLERGREHWTVGIIIAFAVNILAGIVLILI